MDETEQSFLSWEEQEKLGKAEGEGPPEVSDEVMKGLRADATIEELKKLQEMGVMETFVDDFCNLGASFVDMTRVCDWRFRDSKWKCRCRIVTREFKDQFAPTSSFASVRALLALSVLHGLGLMILDKQDAFLLVPQVETMIVTIPKWVRNLDGNGSNNAWLLHEDSMDGGKDWWIDGPSRFGGAWRLLGVLYGLLRRHQELFGHNEEAEYPWRIAPVVRVRDAVSTRKNTLNPNGYVYHIHDSWMFREAEDQRRPTICDEPWIGHPWGQCRPVQHRRAVKKWIHQAREIEDEGDPRTIYYGWECGDVVWWLQSTRWRFRSRRATRVFYGCEKHSDVEDVEEGHDAHRWWRGRSMDGCEWERKKEDPIAGGAEQSKKGEGNGDSETWKKTVSVTSSISKTKFKTILSIQHQRIGKDYRRKFRSLTSDSMDSWKADKRSQVRRKKINTRGESLERRSDVEK